MRAYLFDIDGTLLSSGGAGKGAMAAALAETFGVPESLEGVSISGRTDRVIARDAFAVYDIPDSAENWTSFQSAYVRRLPSFLVTRPGEVLPGIRPLLEHLSERGDCILGLLTGNLREGARLKLGHFGLYEYFEFGGFGDHHLDRDDVAREAIVDAARVLGRPIEPKQAWVVGDTPLDIRCARAIRANAAAVATGFYTVEELAGERPDLLFRDLSDFSPLIQAA